MMNWEDTEGRGGGLEELVFLAVSFSSLNTQQTLNA
jgi:hypothetical protein